MCVICTRFISSLVCFIYNLPLKNHVSAILFLFLTMRQIKSSSWCSGHKLSVRMTSSIPSFFSSTFLFFNCFRLPNTGSRLSLNLNSTMTLFLRFKRLHLLNSAPLTATPVKKRAAQTFSFKSVSGTDVGTRVAGS